MDLAKNPKSTNINVHMNKTQWKVFYFQMDSFSKHVSNWMANVVGHNVVTKKR
jgi:hypothetical protein